MLLFKYQILRHPDNDDTESKSILRHASIIHLMHSRYKTTLRIYPYDTERKF